MKKLLVGFLALGSLSSFAQMQGKTLTLTAKGFAHWDEITCLDSNCSKMKYRNGYADEVDMDTTISYSDIKNAPRKKMIAKTIIRNLERLNNEDSAHLSFRNSKRYERFGKFLTDIVYYGEPEVRQRQVRR